MMNNILNQEDKYFFAKYLFKPRNIYAIAIKFFFHVMFKQLICSLLWGELDHNSDF